MSLTMTDTVPQLCLNEWPAAAAISEYCLADLGRASVRGVGGTDAVLAARLAAGDDHALAEAFDALGAQRVSQRARASSGDDSAAQDVVQDVFVELWSPSRTGTIPLPGRCAPT